MVKKKGKGEALAGRVDTWKSRIRGKRGNPGSHLETL
jgi:hypothetical protein